MTEVCGISNVRVNAAPIGLSSTSTPTQVVMHVSVSDTPVVGPQFAIAMVQPGFGFRVDERTDRGEIYRV